MKSLFKPSLLLLLAIGAAYFFIDRPLCELVNNHGCSKTLGMLLHRLLGWPLFTDADSLIHTGGFLTQLIDWPPLMSGLAPFILLIGISLPPSRIRDLLILMGISLLLTFVLKNDLKWIFSRQWPVTWTNNNLSWIGNHAYGFQWFQGKPFQGNDTTGSFPSGHTATAFASLLPIGLLYRKALPYCMIVASMEGLLMILFNYHFLSDVLAGALVGIACTLAAEKITQSKGGEEGRKAKG